MKCPPDLRRMFILLWGSVTAIAARPCIDFLAPVPGGVITTPACTLLIEEEDCPHRIRKVEFQASYFPANSDTATVISIGSVTSPPYTLIWDISQLPNQLFSGASLFAEATLSNGEAESVRREGVFFLHQKVDRPVYELPYEFTGAHTTSVDPMALPIPRPDMSINASIYWNDKELVFNVDVADPQFDTKVTREQLAAIGTEILIDPSKSRKPFPGKEVFIYSIPLNGKPYRIMYKAVPDDSGTFKFETSTSPCDFNTLITKNSRQGFTIYFPVPIGTFGPRFPESIGCNIVVKTLSPGGRVARSSWVKAGVYNTYSPFLWGELRLRPRPIFMNRPLVGGLTFGIGFFITLVIAALIMLLHRPAVKKVAAQSEADRQQFASIKEVFDSQVIASDVTIESVAKALNVPPRSLSALIRRTTGMEFQTYVMFARIEIAKERLRSSHCTEDSIAEACGFGSRAERSEEHTSELQSQR